ncbi:bifunctional serine/threonine-protein kinase/formylglycine-generating enzyme family protein [Calothrix sp. PCC 6303]|uniref:bifunctional serine/threonine-protein kinase/formylglycine-generating enzyme family protein n=1 Tax=Calothrix sp. PCC 6303 TaxID=1170562 RepID=UPI0002A03ECA|nr:bifunctional serine/threonine-protein kinase/formylglycine-generating enzyme family protein [Calothrix sp. PCC 6303]AFZ02100.1 serine/threonine protein kinase [Calothrix sp. PCC 6303]
MQPGTTLRNRYKIIKLLEEGGFGETFLAEDLNIPIDPKPRCVVKRLKTANLKAEDLEWLKNAFAKEAATLYNLGRLHPQIPGLSEYFQVGNEFYLVQDFIDGVELTNIMTPGKKIPEVAVIQLLTEILEVLAVVHQENIIHRDIKPQNIMRRKADGKIILIDFGAVKQIMVKNTGQTSLTVGIGTPGFMPVEQIMGKPKLASDIYAVGMVGVQALTGIPPHLLDDDEDGEVIWQDKVSVSSRFVDLLGKMVNSRASQRYQSAAEALEAMKLLSQPVNKSPNPPQNQPIAPTVIISPGLPLQVFQFQTVTVDKRGKVTKRGEKQARFFVEKLGNGVSLEMVEIPGGTFMMGSPETEAGTRDNESPQHRVTVPRFFMGKYVVTQAQYQAIMKKGMIGQIFGGNSSNSDPDPSDFKGANRPVETVSWDDAVGFCQKISQKTGKTYRLPSEAEWEYACRAGTTTPFYFGETITTDLANFDGNHTYAYAPKGVYRKETTEVGKFPPNAFGLYDMHGNVWEWCQDSGHSNYNGAPTDGNAWIDNNQNKLLRGGSWYNYPKVSHSAYRYIITREYRKNNVGFRLVFSP